MPVPPEFHSAALFRELCSSNRMSTHVTRGRTGLPTIVLTVLRFWKEALTWETAHFGLPEFSALRGLTTAELKIKFVTFKKRQL